MIPKFDTNYITLMLRHFDIIDVHAEVIKDYDFRQISKLQEYDEEEKEFFFYHKDHLGSSTQISDRDAKIIHHIEYMPSGEQFSEQRDSWSTPYKFNSKELDAETGLYYYGARYYTPEIGIWLSVDPLSDKYPHQSNYMYCSGRLVNVIDPDGRDEWEFDANGKMCNVKPSDKDSFHKIDDNGKRIEGGGLYFNKKIVKSEFSISDKKGKSNYMQISSEDDACQLFEHLSANTIEKQTEFGKAIIKDKKGTIGVVIGVDENPESGKTSANIRLFNKGLNIIELTHNHPNNDSRSSDGDIGVASKVQSKYPNAQFFNYTMGSGYTKYDKNTVPGALQGATLNPVNIYSK